MEQKYHHGEQEARVREIWEGAPRPQNIAGRQPFSTYLVPPNASGPMHVGNALMIALQDVMVRYHRAKGDPTVWIPTIDHGGYETQVTFERESEQRGTYRSKEQYRRHELYSAIENFVSGNISKIVSQIKALGADVDWSRYQYTLDDRSVRSTNDIFSRMVHDDIVYRKEYMVNYCPTCATVLADIELKEKTAPSSIYHVRMYAKDRNSEMVVAIEHVEFLFTVTHILVHPDDVRYTHLIGAELVNPITQAPVYIIASKRKLDAHKECSYLKAFCPSVERYDYEYAIRQGLPAQDVLGWDGKMTERYPGATLLEARAKEIKVLEEGGYIDHIDHTDEGLEYVCKKGHTTCTIIKLSWFVRLDDDHHPLRQPALAALRGGAVTLFPKWREKGLIEWIGKMHDWPIARQNAWGIRIPIFYEIEDPVAFTVWFIDREGTRQHGNLKEFFEAGHTLEDITNGLERVYAPAGCAWTLTKDEKKAYLPETDTFDTWFSSGVWSAMVHQGQDGTVGSFYPNTVVVIGHDLLRLSIAREVVLGMYVVGSVPFRHVYFHSLLRAKDGQKMSKSLGNAVTLDHYLEHYGADVTRMALVSYTKSGEDFHLAEERIEEFQQFALRLRRMGRAFSALTQKGVNGTLPHSLSADDLSFVRSIHDAARVIGSDINRFFVGNAQERAVHLLSSIESFAEKMLARDDIENAAQVFVSVMQSYLTILHPFMPFMTEALYQESPQKNVRSLSLVQWPNPPLPRDNRRF